MRSRRRAGGVALGVAAAAVTLALGPVIARAVSGGGYSYQQQGCSASANRNDAGTNGVPQTEPGCHNFTLQLNQGGGSYTRQWHPFSFNLDQLPNDNSSPHAGSIVVDPGRGTAYTVTFDTGTAHTLGFFPLGYVADAAGWVASTIQTRRLSRPPIPGVGHPKVGKPTVTGPTPGKGGHGPDPRHPDAQLYIGADDNLDNGEHDGVNPTV